MAVTHKSRVAKVARYLDEHHPGWAYKVRLRKLDIASPTHCVLGQLFGDYGHQEAEAVWSAQDTWVCGERCNTQATALAPSCNYADADLNPRYTELWKHEIRIRRGNSGTN